MILIITIIIVFIIDKMIIENPFDLPSIHVYIGNYIISIVIIISNSICQSHIMKNAKLGYYDSKGE